MSSPTELVLTIVDNTCACGNRWTHSYPLLAGSNYFGGTPSPEEEHTLPVTRIAKQRRLYSHCFRCIPLVLPTLGLPGWQPITPVREQGQRALTRRPPSRLTFEELEASIFKET